MEQEKSVKFRSGAFSTLQVRERLRQILAFKDSPQLIAISFAIGLFIGMSPLLGVHTLLGIAVAWRFRLNKVVTLLGVWVTNPWTIIPIYTFGTWTGARLLGVRKVIPEIDWNSITFIGLIGKCRHILVPFIVGNTLIALIAAVIGYFLIYTAVKSNRA